MGLLDFIAQHIPASMELHKDEALGIAAGAGAVALVNRLLQMGADPKGKNGLAMVSAAWNGQVRAGKGSGLRHGVGCKG
jgi:hypothetical protein